MYFEFYEIKMLCDEDYLLHRRKDITREENKKKQREEREDSIVFALFFCLFVIVCFCVVCEKIRRRKLFKGEKTKNRKRKIITF